MSYAPPDHWNQVFAKWKDAGTDLDWGTQWTKVHLPFLKSANVKTVLDLGCGTGNDVLRLVRQGFIVIGVDFSDEAVQQGREKAKKLVLQGGSQKSKVKSQKYYGMGFLGILNGCYIYAVAY